MTLDPGFDRLSDAFAAGQLPLHHCRECGAFSEPRTALCPVCRSTALEDVPASGRAQVVSWSRTHRGPGSGEVTRTFVIAQLEEGPWWWGEVIGAGHERIVAGDPLRLAFRRGPDGRPLPVFCSARD